MSKGNLSVEAQARYAYIERSLTAEVPVGATVVELGAAPGDQIARFADLGYDSVALDIDIDSDNWGDGDVGRMRKLFVDHGVTYVPWNMEDLPYPIADASADAVIMTEVFEHLRDYPINSLREARRILKPTGRLYFTTPNQAYLMNRLRLLAGKNVATPLDDWISGQVFARHAREYTFDEVKRLMALADLDIVSLTSRHFHLDSGKQGVVARATKSGISKLAEWRPSLGPQIIVVATPRV